MRSWEGCLFLYDLRHQTCYCYNSISLASSSEKSDMELSEEEERSSWTILIWKSLIFHQISVCTCSPPHWSLKASSVAYFFTYSATFFLYSSGLRIDLFRRTSSRKYSDCWLTCEDTLLLHLRWEDLWGWGRSGAGAGKTRIYWRDHRALSRPDWWHPNTQFLTPRQCWDDTPKKQQTE